MDKSRTDRLNHQLTFIVNISVVVGIIFLGFELRQNTRAIQAQTRDSITEKQMTYLGWRATSPELAALVGRVSSTGTTDGLSDGESQQFNAYLAGQFREWENSFYQYEQGLFTQGEYEARRERWRAQMSDRTDSGAYRDLWASARDQFAPNFRAEIDQIVATASN